MWFKNIRIEVLLREKMCFFMFTPALRLVLDEFKAYILVLLSLSYTVVRFLENENLSTNPKSERKCFLPVEVVLLKEDE